ncbi:MAG TPA: GntR family transcriptional regulator [Acidimicrobiia bacterium]|jgi:DNA-binding GntR family transcriptional regulator|nr:GntR family transcriptional regulator [Acidimicrobiia bacterium]
MASASRLAIDQWSAPQQVANGLRDLLLTGEIPPGVKLREVQLSKEVGVSRHTLRSAFRILEAEGLLQHSLNRGVIVPELSEDRIADVFKARKALEFTGVHSIDLDEAGRRVIDQMELSIDRMLSSRDDVELAAADLEYHSAVVAAVGSHMIDELYRNIQAQLRLTRAWAVRTRGDRELMAKTHEVVVRFLREGRKAEAASELMSINDVGEKRLLTAMSENRGTETNRPVAWPPDD